MLPLHNLLNAQIVLRRGRTFLVHEQFSVCKLMYFDSSFTEIGSQWSNWKQTSFGSMNGLAPICTNDGLRLLTAYMRLSLSMK